MYLKDFFYLNTIRDFNIVQNINYDDSANQKRALICYLAKGYFINLEHNIGRTIVYEIFKIIKVFSEMDYCIDLVDGNNPKLIPLVADKNYDLIFGFGETFYQISTLQPMAISILYLTENLPEFSYKEEKKRLDYFFERHKKRVKIQRSGQFYKLYHLEKKYSEIITLGEIKSLNQKYKNIYSIFPTGIINSKFSYKEKDHLLSRKRFLWLGSSGAIHKGLDILIDVFKNRDDITLIIGGLIKPDKKVFDFPNRNNILDCGYIDIKSEAFLKITENCSYIILPSCSEGFSTSIATGMLHGLIPIVMKDTGFNKLMDNAIFLDDYSIEYIDNKLSELSCDSPDDLNRFSEKVYNFAQNNFTSPVFETNFRKIINRILNQVD